MKNLIEKYILETQLWVSVMMSCLCLFFGLLHKSVDYNRIFIVFFCTLAAYNFIDFHASWNNRNLFRKIQGILFLTGTACSGYLLWKENSWEQLSSLLFLSIFVILYNSSFLVVRFRNISVLKIFVISFVWTCFVLKVGNTFVFSFGEFLSIFLFIIGITIPFDISDMERDSIQTIPRVLGVEKGRQLACLCLVSSGLLFFYIFPMKTDFVLSWNLACLLAIILILFMHKKETHFYTRFWIEACSSLPLIIFYLIQK